MLTSKQAIRLQISKPEAGGGCEVGQNSGASQGKKKLREKGKNVPLSSLALLKAHGKVNNYFIAHMSTHVFLNFWNVTTKPQASSKRQSTLLNCRI